MNRVTGRYFPSPTEAAVDFDDTVAVTAAESGVTKSRSQTADISSTLSSSASKDDVYNPKLRSVADAWMKDSSGMKKAAC